MFGHGCPHLVFRARALLLAVVALVAIALGPNRSFFPALDSCWAQQFGALESTLQSPQTAAVAQQQKPRISAKLRFSWGGGDAQAWQGKITIEGATISSVAPLGVTPDATASVRESGNSIVVNHWSPTNYGGADVELNAPLDAKIHFVLTSTENPESIFEQTITVEQLLAQSIAAELDESGNRFSAARVPGDALGVEFEKPHLVFKPGELFRLSVKPKLTGLGSKTANCRVKVVLAGSSGVGPRAYFSKSIPFTLDELGSAEQPIELEIPVPNQEEIYNVELELEPVWYQASLGAKSNSVKRSVQFIVLNQRPEVPDNRRRWRQVSVADPANFDQPVWNQIPKLGRAGRTSLGNDLRTKTLVGPEEMLTLEAGGWQAIPLEVGRLGEPHVIELEYVSDESVSIGVSMLQPDASGQIPLYGFDSGLFVPNSLVTGDSKSSASQVKIERHRMTVWPNTKIPFLLVANRHASGSVTIGKVRVFAGPTQLPAREFESADSNSRKLMAFYESPLFAENFGALATRDTDYVEPLDDWRMFYIGASRLIDYLKANSYRGAFITVACEGSAIFPSRHLASTPKHDNGVFFNTGQDPIRKDVLEMLFRMFEREGLTLVPSLALSAPLAEVEALRELNVMEDESGKPAGEGEVVNGFDLVDLNSNKRQPAIGDELPIYNPLDDQVQQSVTRVVGEIADRYQQHSSFDGVAIICRPDTYSLLPGRQWGYDNSTVAKFIQSQPELETSQLDEVKGLLTSSYRKQWIQWRAEQMTLWYQKMLSTVRQSVPQGTLYLAPVDLFRNKETASALSPSLHVSNDFKQVMLRAGLDLERLQPSGNGQFEDGKLEQGGVVLLNPHRISPEESFSSQRVDYAIQHSDQAKQFFNQASYRADLFTHRTAWAHFSQLQEQSPFGEQASNLMRLQPMSPAGQFNCRRFVEAIKERDARLLIDGGPIMSFGQEAAFTELMSVFNQLPDQQFTDVGKTDSPTTPDSQAERDSLPIAVRQLSSRSESFFYVANASPWPIQLRVFAKTGGNVLPVINSLSTTNLVARQPLEQSSAQSTSSDSESGSFEIAFEVPAFGLVGGRSDTAGFAIEDFEFTLPEGADKVLKKQVYGLEAKLTKSSNPPPLDVIQNPNFESSGQPSLSGWDAGQQAAGKVSLGSSPDSVAPGQAGTGALLMSNQDASPVWIRSNTFMGPATGRLSISVWLKTNQADAQPPLRLAVEGQSKGTDYYRFGSVGSLSPDPSMNQVGSQWKRFAVHFDDLPVDGLTNVRVGFDLMGPGEVLIDNVQIFDRWFDENDAKAITQMLASTGPLLSKPETIDSCRRLLESYWVQFLDRYVDPGPTTAASDSSQADVRQAKSQPREQGESDAGTDYDFYQPGEYQPSEYQPNEYRPNEYQPNNGQAKERPRVPMFRRFRSLVPTRKPQLR